jgi:amidohydrolase
MLDRALAIQEQLTRWRRTIHRHPELGFEVHRTAAFVATTLVELGISARTGVGKTGVVGTLGDGNSPIIALRADMDALPLQEENAVEYVSQVPGRMHACGHDAHTAILLGAAALLNGQALPGQVRLLFQPSEESMDSEGVSGARRMIADGALDGADVVIGLHVDATLDTGQVGLEDGWIGAAVDKFRASIIGQGGHGAYPHRVVDPVWLTSLVLNALYAIPSRRVAPLEPCVVTVGVIHGGSAENIVPDEVILEGTLRSYANDVREQLIHEVDRAFNLARIYGGDYQLNVDRGYPASFNDPLVTSWLRQVTGDLLGWEQISPTQKSMGAEDFSFMTQVAKGAMLSLGVKPPGATPRHLHTSTFDLDEDALPIGAAILAEMARRYLAGQLPQSS